MNRNAKKGTENVYTWEDIVKLKLANFVYFCITVRDSQIDSQIRSIQNSQTIHGCIFQILRYFVTKHRNFTKLVMLFPAVVNFPNSKVCLKG